MEPKYFKSSSAFRKWLRQNHDKASELWVVYGKKGTDLENMSWSESVDEALCFGWIDGLRQSIDARTYRIRFTPRKPGSTWSAININKVELLTRTKRMTPAGKRAFAKRREDRSAIYSHERPQEAKLDNAYERKLKATPAAWKYFSAMSPSCRRANVHWVMSAKKEETRLRRLDTLIRSSAEGQKIPPFRIGQKQSP